MLETQVAALLAQYLGKFIQNVSEEKLKVSLWNGELVLQNVQLQPDFIEQIFLLVTSPELSVDSAREETAHLKSLLWPLTLVKGVIAELVIIIPWATLSAQSASVRMNGVEVVLAPLRAAPYDANTEQARKRELKKKQLSLYEKNTSTTVKTGHLRGGSDSLGSSFLTALSPLSYIQSSLREAFQNMTVELSNISIVYEFYYPGLSPELSSAVLFHMGQMKIETEQQQEQDPKGGKSIVGNISQLEVVVCAGRLQAEGELSFKQVRSLYQYHEKMVRIDSAVVAVRPPSPTNEALGVQITTENRFGVNVSFGCVTKLLEMVTRFRNGLVGFENRQHLHLLMESSALSVARRRWKFAVTCVLEQVRRRRSLGEYTTLIGQHRSRLDNMVTFSRRRKVYCELFKRLLPGSILPPLDDKEKSNLVYLEDDVLSLEQILFLRCLAMADLDYDIERHAAQQRWIEEAKERTSSSGRAGGLWGWVIKKEESAHQTTSGVAFDYRKANERLIESIERNWQSVVDVLYKKQFELVDSQINVSAPTNIVFHLLCSNLTVTVTPNFWRQGSHEETVLLEHMDQQLVVQMKSVDYYYDTTKEIKEDRTLFCFFVGYVFAHFSGTFNTPLLESKRSETVKDCVVIRGNTARTRLSIVVGPQIVLLRPFHELLWWTEAIQCFSRELQQYKALYSRPPSDKPDTSLGIDVFVADVEVAIPLLPRDLTKADLAVSTRSLPKTQGSDASFFGSVASTHAPADSVESEEVPPMPPVEKKQKRRKYVDTLDTPSEDEAEEVPSIINSESVASSVSSYVNDGAPEIVYVSGDPCVVLTIPKIVVATTWSVTIDRRRVRAGWYVLVGDDKRDRFGRVRLWCQMKPSNVEMISFSYLQVVASKWDAMTVDVGSIDTVVDPCVLELLNELFFKPVSLFNADELEKKTKPFVDDIYNSGDQWTFTSADEISFGANNKVKRIPMHEGRYYATLLYRLKQVTRADSGRTSPITWSRPVRVTTDFANIVVKDKDGGDLVEMEFTYPDRVFHAGKPAMSSSNKLRAIQFQWEKGAGSLRLSEGTLFTGIGKSLGTISNCAVEYHAYKEVRATIGEAVLYYQTEVQSLLESLCLLKRTLAIATVPLTKMLMKDEAVLQKLRSVKKSLQLQVDCKSLLVELPINNRSDYTAMTRAFSVHLRQAVLRYGTSEKDGVMLSTVSLACKVADCFRHDMDDMGCDEEPFSLFGPATGLSSNDDAEEGDSLPELWLEYVHPRAPTETVPQKNPHCPRRLNFEVKGCLCVSLYMNIFLQIFAAMKAPLYQRLFSTGKAVNCRDGFLRMGVALGPWELQLPRSEFASSPVLFNGVLHQTEVLLAANTSSSVQITDDSTYFYTVFDELRVTSTLVPVGKGFTRHVDLTIDQITYKATNTAATDTLTQNVALRWRDGFYYVTKSTGEFVKREDANSSSCVITVGGGLDTNAVLRLAIPKDRLGTVVEILTLNLLQCNSTIPYRLGEPEDSSRNNSSETSTTLAVHEPPPRKTTSFSFQIPPIVIALQDETTEGFMVKLQEGLLFYTLVGGVGPSMQSLKTGGGELLYMSPSAKGKSNPPCKLLSVENIELSTSRVPDSVRDVKVLVEHATLEATEMEYWLALKRTVFNHQVTSLIDNRDSEAVGLPRSVSDQFSASMIEQGLIQHNQPRVVKPLLDFQIVAVETSVNVGGSAEQPLAKANVTKLKLSGNYFEDSTLACSVSVNGAQVSVKEMCGVNPHEGQYAPLFQNGYSLAVVVDIRKNCKPVETTNHASDVGASRVGAGGFVHARVSNLSCMLPLCELVGLVERCKESFATFQSHLKVDGEDTIPSPPLSKLSVQLNGGVSLTITERCAQSLGKEPLLTILIGNVCVNNGIDVERYNLKDNKEDIAAVFCPSRVWHVACSNMNMTLRQLNPIQIPLVGFTVSKPNGSELYAVVKSGFGESFTALEEESKETYMKEASVKKQYIVTLGDREAERTVDGLSVKHICTLIEVWSCIRQECAGLLRPVGEGRSTGHDPETAFSVRVYKTDLHVYKSECAESLPLVIFSVDGLQFSISSTREDILFGASRVVLSDAHRQKMLSLQQKTDACEAVTVKVHRLTGDIAVDAASVSVELNEGLVDVLKQQWVEWKSANLFHTGSVSTRPATERRCCIREINVSLPRGVVLWGEQLRVSLPPNSSEFSFTMDGITLRHRVGAIQQDLVESAGVTFVVTREQWEVRTNTITVKDACSSGLGHFLKSIQEMSPVLKHFRRDASAPPSERRILFHSSQTQVYLTPVKKAESPHSFLVELRSPKMAVSFTNSTTGSSLNVKVGETTVSCGTETDGVFTCEFCFVENGDFSFSQTVDRVKAEKISELSTSPFVLNVMASKSLQYVAEAVLLLTRRFRRRTAQRSAEPMVSKWKVHVPTLSTHLFLPSFEGSCVEVRWKEISFSRCADVASKNCVFQIQAVTSVCHKEIQPLPMVQLPQCNETAAPGLSFTRQTSAEDSSTVWKTTPIRLIVSPVLLNVVRLSIQYVCTAIRKVQAVPWDEEGPLLHSPISPFPRTAAASPTEGYGVTHISGDICFSEDIHLGGKGGRRLVFGKGALNSLPQNVITITSTNQAKIIVAPFEYTDGSEEACILVESGITVKVSKTPFVVKAPEKSIQSVVETRERSIFLIPEVDVTFVEPDEDVSTSEGSTEVHRLGFTTTVNVDCPFEVSLWNPNDSLNCGGHFRLEYRRETKAGLVSVESGSAHINRTSFTSTIGAVLQRSFDFNASVTLADKCTQVEVVLPPLDFSFTPTQLNVLYHACQSLGLRSVFSRKPSEVVPKQHTVTTTSSEMEEYSIAFVLSSPQVSFALLNALRQPEVVLSLSKVAGKSQAPRSVLSCSTVLSADVRLDDFPQRKQRSLLRCSPVVELDYVNVNGGALLSVAGHVPLLEATCPFMSVLHYRDVANTIVSMPRFNEECYTISVKNELGTDFRLVLKDKSIAAESEAFPVSRGTVTPLPACNFSQTTMHILLDEGVCTESMCVGLLSERTLLKTESGPRDALDYVVLRYDLTRREIRVTTSVKIKNELSVPVAVFNFEKCAFVKIGAQQEAFLPYGCVSAPMLVSLWTPSLDTNLVADQLPFSPCFVHNITFGDFIRAALSLSETQSEEEKTVGGVTLPFNIFAIDEASKVSQRAVQLRVAKTLFAHSGTTDDAAEGFDTKCFLMPSKSIVNCTGVEMRCTAVGLGPSVTMASGEQFDILANGIQTSTKLELHITLPAVASTPERILNAEVDLNTVGTGTFVQFENSDFSAVLIEPSSTGNLFYIRSCGVLRNFLPCAMSVYSASGTFCCQLESGESSPLFYTKDQNEAFLGDAGFYVTVRDKGNESSRSIRISGSSGKFWQMLSCKFANGNCSVFSVEGQEENTSTIHTAPLIDFRSILSIKNEHKELVLWVKAGTLTYPVSPQGLLDLTLFTDEKGEHTAFQFAYGYQEKRTFDWCTSMKIGDILQLEERQVLKIRTREVDKETKEEVFINSRVPMVFEGHFEMESFGCLSLLSTDGYNKFGLHVDLLRQSPVVIENRTPYNVQFCQQVTRVERDTDAVHAYIASPKTDCPVSWDRLPLPRKVIRFTIFEQGTNAKVAETTMDLGDASSASETIVLSKVVFAFCSRVYHDGNETFIVCFTDTRLLEAQIKTPITSLTSVELTMKAVLLHLSAQCHGDTEKATRSKPIYKTTRKTLTEAGVKGALAPLLALSEVNNKEFDIFVFRVTGLELYSTLTQAQTLFSVRCKTIDVADCTTPSMTAPTLLTAANDALYFAVHLVNNASSTTTGREGSTSRVVIIREAELEVAPVTIHLVDAVVVTAVDAWHNVRTQWAKRPSSPTVVHKPRSLAEVYVKKVSISPIRVELSWRTTESSLVLPISLLLVSSVEKAPIRFGKYEAHSLYYRSSGVLSALGLTVMKAYTPLLMLQLVRVIGALEAYGNPLYLLRCWGRGLDAFFKDTFIQRDLKGGTKALLRETASSTFHSIGLVTQFGGRTLSSLFVEQEDTTGETKRGSLRNGVKTLFSEPFRKGSQEGFSGMLGGMGSSVIGLVSLPMAVALNGISRSAQFLAVQLDTQQSDVVPADRLVYSQRNFTALIEDFSNRRGDSPTLGVAESLSKGLLTLSAFNAQLQLAITSGEKVKAFAQRVGVGNIALYADFDVFLQCAEAKEFVEWFPTAMGSEIKYILYIFAKRNELSLGSTREWKKVGHVSREGQSWKFLRGKFPPLYQIRHETRTLLNATLSVMNVNDLFDGAPTTISDEAVRALHIQQTLGKESLLKFVTLDVVAQICPMEELKTFLPAETLLQEGSRLHQIYGQSFATLLKQMILQENA